MRAAADPTRALATRNELAAAGILGTYSKVGVWQTIHRLREHGYRIRTIPCPQGDGSKGGYALLTTDEEIAAAGQLPFSVLE